MKNKILVSLLAASIALTTIIMPASAMQPVSTAGYSAADVSHHQTITDWGAIRQQLGAVYIKATEGATYTDPSFSANASGAVAAGIPVGFYHFFRLTQINIEYVDAQAQAFYSAIRGYPYQLVPALDVEVTDGQGKEVISSSVQEFCSRFTALSGQPIMIYASPSFADDCFEPALNVYPYWEAHYTSAALPRDTGIWSAWTQWQYTSSGSVRGISGRVDLDRATGGIFLISAPKAPEQPLQKPKTVYSKAVAAYQTKLNRLKISSLVVDGILGPKTRGAVVTWEKINGLAPDGIWGSRCEAKYQAVAAKPTLRQGSTGYAVRYIQYRVGTKVDGKFGPATKAAVRSFQRANGLRADGIVGKMTYKALIGG